MTTPETATCACGHLVVVHEFKPATKTLPDRRGECSHSDAKGPCPCKGPR